MRIFGRPAEFDERGRLTDYGKSVRILVWCRSCRSHHYASTIGEGRRRAERHRRAKEETEGPITFGGG